VQNAQRLAASGISLRHCGHSRVGTSTGVSVRRRDIRAFTGFTTKKKITAARIRNAISALMNDPYRKWLPLTVKLRF